MHHYKYGIHKRKKINLVKGINARSTIGKNQCNDNQYDVKNANKRLFEKNNDKLEANEEVTTKTRWKRE